MTQILQEEHVPLAVWPCGQTASGDQLRGRYLPGSLRQVQIVPDLARRIVATYTFPGALVVDPLCRVGTVPLEAAALGRRAIGVVRTSRMAERATANLDNALPPSDRGRATITVCTPNARAALLAGLRGRVDAVITRANASPGIDGQSWPALEDLARACWAALRPGGLFITVTSNALHGDRLMDYAAHTSRFLRSHGFGYLQHVVAITAPVADGRLQPRPIPSERARVVQARRKGLPVHLHVHEDVLVFAKSGGTQ